MLLGKRNVSLPMNASENGTSNNSVQITILEFMTAPVSSPWKIRGDRLLMKMFGPRE